MDYSLCTNEWVSGPWSEWDSYCSPSAERYRQVRCERSDGTLLPNEQCPSDSRPATMEEAGVFESCGYRWEESEWVSAGPVTMCGSHEQTRIVRCVSESGSGAEDSQCGGEKPETSRLLETTEDCTYRWEFTPWTETPGCGKVEQTRTAACIRSDGKSVDAEMCGGNPETVVQDEDYRACGFDWQISAWNEWDSACSSKAVRNRSVKCIRSDGKLSADANCVGPTPPSTEQSEIYSGCSYDWTTTPWSKPQGCGQVTQTRQVTCTRTDGTGVEGTFCDSATRPAEAEVVTDYGACSYRYEASEWGAWSSTCQAGASRNRTVTCVRDDGTPAAEEALCLEAGTRPVSTEISDIYTGCSYEWGSMGWSAPTPACGNTTITETFACRRSNGAVVSDDHCEGARPENTAQVQDYRACQYSWHAGAWGAWDSSCSDQAARVREITCQTSTGIVTRDHSLCEGDAPSKIERSSNYSGCTYEWDPGQWTSAAYCGPVTETRTPVCRRTDGLAVQDYLCTGERPITERQGTNYNACTYAWATGAWSNYDSACSATATRRRAVECERSDKTIVEDNKCTGVRPEKLEQTSIYTGCEYKWTTYPWQSTYSCSEADVQTRRVECTRIDDISSTVSDSFCSSMGPKPAASQTVINVETCTTSLVNGGFESGLTAWNYSMPVTATATLAHGGSTSIKMDPNGQLRQYIQTVAGKTYTLSYWAYIKRGLFMNSYGAQGKVIENRQLTNTDYQWVHHTGTFVGTGWIVQIGFYHYAPSGGSSWLDDVTVTAN
ncbi:hypothetical protein [Sphingomonas sp. 3-13AW]|uniref:hypothetical protein n=1 Tax=Sphingomonas sp. 3-13AW TaxID=3050450 RepID=UPI003BB5CD22